MNFHLPPRRLLHLKTRTGGSTVQNTTWTLGHITRKNGAKDTDFTSVCSSGSDLRALGSASHVQTYLTFSFAHRHVHARFLLVLSADWSQQTTSAQTRVCVSVRLTCFRFFGRLLDELDELDAPAVDALRFCIACTDRRSPALTDIYIYAFSPFVVSTDRSQLTTFAKTPNVR